MHTRPSEIAVEAAKGLTDFLDGKVGTKPLAARVEADWESLRTDLRADGWLDVGTELVQAVSDCRQLVVDAVHLAAAFGRYLIAVPFIEVLADQVSQALPDRTEQRVDGPAMVSFPDEMFQSSGPVDWFAPSLPTGAVEVGTIRPQRLRIEATLRAAGAVSAMRAGFTDVVEYSRTREAYGQVIGSFQALKHLMADMFVALELAESGCIWAANDLDNALASCEDVLSRCLWVGGRCVQIYGGIGFTWEAGVHYYVRHVIAAQRLNRAYQDLDSTLT